MTDREGFDVPRLTLEEYVQIMGETRVLEWLGAYQEKAVSDSVRDVIDHSGRCNDPRCDIHGHIATAYKNPIPKDVGTREYNDGEVELYAISNERLRIQATAEVHSCTGPVTMTVRFPRELLHELHVGPETVEIELAEAVE